MDGKANGRLYCNCRPFFRITGNDDGTCDVWLVPLTGRTRMNESDVQLLVARGIVPFDGIEDDIRRRYDSWCQSAELVSLDSAMILKGGGILES